MTVTVRQPSSDGGATPGVPLAGASVTLVSYLNDFDDPLQVLVGTTGAGGAAAIAGVARPEAGGPPVYLAVEGFLQLQAPGAEPGCLETTTWFGLSADVSMAGPETVVEVVASDSASVACPPPGVVLRGTIRGPGGSTLEAAFGWVSVVTADEEAGVALVLGPDGGFEVELPALGTVADPASVVLEFASLPTRFEPFGEDCVRTFAQATSWGADIALGEGEAPPELELVTSEFLAGEQCGETGEGGEGGGPGEVPGGQAPGGETGVRVTLPPTDAGDVRSAAPGSGAGAIVGLAGLLLIAAAVAGATARAMAGAVPPPDVSRGDR